MNKQPLKVIIGLIIIWREIRNKRWCRELKNGTGFMWEEPQLQTLCSAYLLLHKKLPQNLVAYSSSSLLSHNSYGSKSQEQLSLVIMAQGLSGIYKVWPGLRVCFQAHPHGGWPKAWDAQHTAPLGAHSRAAGRVSGPRGRERDQNRIQCLSSYQVIWQQHSRNNGALGFWSLWREALCFLDRQAACLLAVWFCGLFWRPFKRCSFPFSPNIPPFFVCT